MPKKARQKRKAKKAKATEEEKLLDDNPVGLKEEGIKAFKVGNVKKANAFFTKAIETIMSQKAEKRDTSLHLALLSNRSACFIEQHKFKNAADDADTCISIDTKWPKGYVRRGIAYSKLQRYVDALSAFKTALSLDANLKLEVYMKPVEMNIKELSLVSDNISAPDDEKREAYKIYEKMFSWLRAHGAKIGDIYLNLGSRTGRGVHVLCDVAIGWELLRIPEKLLLTLKIAKSTPLADKIKKSGYEVRSEQTFMALYLLEQLQDKDSFWRWYLRTLPQGKTLSPLFYPEIHQRLLAGSQALQTLAFRAQGYREEYAELCTRVGSIRRFSLTEFMWARCCVLSRMIGLRKKTNKMSAMVPLLDMVNHGKPSSVHWAYDDDTEHVHVIANQPIKRKEEIFANYGRKANSRYFTNYGFTLDKNPENESVLVFTMAPSAAFYQEKSQLLTTRARRGQNGWINREFAVSATPRDMKFRRMLSFLRYISAEGKDYELFKKGNFDIEAIGPVSIKNELEVLKLIEQSATSALNAFPESLAADHRLLKRNQWMEATHRHCVRVRCSEKEVLAWYINLAKKGREILQRNWSGVRRSEISKLKDVKEASVANYLLTITPLLTDPNCK